jgi:hypothetical protein
MPAIQLGELPPDSLLNPYKGSGAYTDCYFMDVPRAVTQSEYIEAFYTSAVFKFERTALGLLVARPANDLQARQLATGELAKFSAWRVEARTPNQLLLCDFTGRTRSWLMSTNVGDSAAPDRTRLYFGSAVVPKRVSASGRASFGLAFHALRGFHRIYTHALMRSACAWLEKAVGA